MPIAPLFRAVGILASHLNLSADALLFLNRSKSYRRVWNSERGLMCPRSRNGEFHCPLDPTLHEWMFKDSGYTEGRCLTYWGKRLSYRKIAPAMKTFPSKAPPYAPTGKHSGR